MKRRVQIAKALVHDPPIIILDEPTAGVDIELRHMLWDYLRELNANGKTILLTTHYIEEAEAIADRVGVMNKGKILLLSDKKTLIKKMGKKELKIELHDPVLAIPESLDSYKLSLTEQKTALLYSYDTSANRTGITKLLNDISKAGLILKDVSTRQSSLEDIFTNLLEEKK
jgi:ABC-2 type transport system ATP-binding protein